MDKPERSEKEIAELCEMAYVYTGGIVSIDDGIKDAMKKGGYIELKRLYDAGYRKEEEVRKETLQDLFTALQTHGQLFDYSGDDNAGFWAIDLEDVKDVIKQKFGVEVEE